jgi:NADH dehydrogenase FAD-containing subunit
VDRRNYHLFQPLLYQVATSTLSATEIAAPVRHILRAQTNLTCLMAEAEAIDLALRRVRLADGRALAYDFLVLASGSSHSYFGHDEWAAHAPGLKTLEDALEIRRRFLTAFEQAEQESDPDLSVPGFPEAFVIGDLAAVPAGGERILPGLAPVAIQAGRAAARAILARQRGRPAEPFRYQDRGTMATIGRGRAIAQVGRLRMDGFTAWLAWLFIHLLMLVGYQNRILVLIEWVIAYLTTQHRSRLILAPFRPWRVPAASERQGDVD